MTTSNDFENQEFSMTGVYCRYEITSETIDVSTISEKIGITPYQTFSKGEKTVSKYSGSVLIKPHNLWALQSPPTISAEIELATHIQFFQNLLKDKVLEIQEFMNDPVCHCIFRIILESEDAGVSFTITEADAKQVYSYANEILFSIVFTEAQ